MRILCIYHNRETNPRNTIQEHLYSFQNYSQEACFYLNVARGIPFFITRIKFDLVVYHYTFTALKWNGNENFKRLLSKPAFQRLKKLSGYKISIPQDEYVNSDAVCSFFKAYGIKTVYTCVPPDDYQTIYPSKKSGLEYYFTIPAGYIDEKAVDQLKPLILPIKERGVDIGNRVRKVPYWLGEFGQLKYEIARQVAMSQKTQGLNVDISFKPEDVFLGPDWYRFLISCKVVVGTESGASLHDPDGEIRETVERYVQKHPEADFFEVRDHCFKGHDYNINLFAVSPRHFECCITKTCQVLVEGEYNGILKPNQHYIPVKKDFSNLDAVIEKIRDVAYCQEIVDNAYRDIVESGKYTYREFVRKVLTHVQGVAPVHVKADEHNDSFYVWLLKVWIALTDFISLIYFKTYSVALFVLRNVLPMSLWSKIRDYKHNWNTGQNRK